MPNDRKVEPDHDHAPPINAPAVLMTSMGHHSEGKPITAIPVLVKRDHTKIMAEIKSLAAMAGADYYYRWTVPNRKKGTTEIIEGPSIALANDLVRLYGNCTVELVVVDNPDHWIIYARFVDYERGSTLARAFRQRKVQHLGKMDEDRALDIVFQIAQSKAIRNVVVNFLRTYANFAFDEAKGSLVKKLEDDEQFRRHALERIQQWFDENKIEVKRVERAVGRVFKEWAAMHIARVMADIKSVKDGMVEIDDLYPAPEPPVDGSMAHQPKTAEETRKSNEDLEGGAGKEATTDKDAANDAAADEAAAKAAAAEKEEAERAQKEAERAAAEAERLAQEAADKAKAAKEAAAAKAKPAAKKKPDEKPAAPKEDAPQEPADDEPRKLKYTGPPNKWVANEFIPLLKRMGTVEHVDAFMRFNESNLTFVKKVSEEAWSAAMDAEKVHRKDLVEASK